MYNNLSKTRRGRPWLLLVALFAWLLPQTAAAEQYIHEPDNYSISLGGTNIIYFKAPVYDQKNVDQWVDYGYLYVSVDGGTPQRIFHWGSREMNIDSDATEVETTFRSYTDGFFDITLGNQSKTVRLTKNNKEYYGKVKRNSDGYSFSYEAEWVVPYNLLGKKLTFSWDVMRFGNTISWSYEKVTGLKTVTINMPEASAKLTPFVSSPMMDPNTPGKLQLPWFLLSDSITKAYYEYHDAAGKYFKEDIENMNSGIIVLDANVPHKNLRVVCDYKEQGDKGSYLIEGVGSSPHNVPFIHGPVGLTARPLDERTPKVELTWNVPYPDDEDLTPTDFFEIQRSLTGKEEDFRTISSSVFYAYNDKKTLYTYVDSTLLEAIQTSMLTGGGTLDHLTYRVRRAITQNWGWGADNRCATTASCVMDNLHLLRIKDYSAQWEDSLSYTARVSWQYADEHGAVWDDRAKMMLRVTMKNREGDIVDSLVYTLTDDERAQRYKIVNLTRSCVTYDIEMYVDRNTSPINQLADVEQFYFPIRSEADWSEFIMKVQNAEGKYDVNACLYADLNIYSPVGWLPEKAYRGIFDGNGHTLTFQTSMDERFMAPFRYVGNATIKNLHTAGTITTSNMNAAGLIANVLEGSSVAIENCRSSVVINSSYNGATENGGFISRQSGATVVIKNSKFDGAFEGDNSSENGGFVGWVARGSTLSIDYSLFAPDHLSTKADKCDTWAVLDSLNVTYTLTNSHATREFTATIMIANAADWHKFAVMVNEAVNQYDVNAILTADITTSEHVGVTEGAVYRGTFDGNGHTLTFNKDWTENEQFIAPFRHASNATIKNLHVAGTIKSGQKYPAGIIAQVINGTTTIENCRSSVTLNSTITGESTLAGGLVGRVSNSKVTIRNSKFDGSFEGDKSIGNGGFIAWVGEKSSATIIDCLFMPASVKTDPELSETWARQDEKGTVSIANCYATEEFCRIINDANDWEAFRTALSNRGSKSVNAILNANFSIDHSAVNFKGTFDGNGHTLNLNGTDGMFLSAEDYTIKNLHVTGSMGGDQHVAGLVGSSFRGNIQSCWVSVGIHCNTTHAGGFIGHAHDTQHTIKNCLFDGSVSAKNDGKNDGTSYVGAFIGWAGDADNYVTNCLEDGNYYYVNHAGFCYKGNGDAWGNTGNSKNNCTYKGVSWNEVNYDGIRHNNIRYVVKELGDGWYAEGDNALPKMTRRDLWNNVGSLSANDLASKLGNGWYVEDGKVLPVMALGTAGVSEEELAQYYGNGWTKEGDKLMPATTTEAYYEYATLKDPKLKGMFYHKNNGTIDKTLLTQTRQSSVLLSWSTDDKPIDFFRVLRRVQGQGEDAWQEVATDLTDMSYEDTSVSPLLTYEYKVEAVNNCEGRTASETNATVGECKHTGRVEGYVRFNDGTGAPAISVIVTYNDNTVATAKTDESGYFEVVELSYQGGTDVTYSVGPAAESGVNIDPVAVTFDATSNNRVLREFTIENGRRFSGYVMYEGTSIPVKGVNFLVDGNRIHNAQGKYVETDYDGSFSFRVLNGQHTIQAVMDKHVFTNDGWYKNSQKQNLTADVAGVYFYDDTKVTLTGRIVGGDDQGLKPLMNNLSQNNLGDSLTMVLTLEGDNTSWLVYDNQHPNRTKREEVVSHPVKGDKHYTQVTTERKRMVVQPDAATGEYTLKLPPVRWKVQQVYCSGYATLFQEGQVSEVIDLTNALDTVKVNYDGIYYDADEQRVENPTAKYHAVYNRIYHSPVEVTYKQIGYDNFDYLGDKTYASSELTGETVQVPLVYSVRKPNWPANRKDSLVAVYTLGHPVFSIERKYNIQLQVGERYLYNNDPLGRVDMVPLKGGMAYMQNGMRALSMDDQNTIKEPQELDSLGQCVFTLKADQTSNMSNCLRTVTFTVERDGTIIQAEPLQGYVLNMIPAGAGQDIMTEGAPILYDILRDPPGAYSTNTLAKGATINFTYMMNASITAGPVVTLKYGEKLQTVTASVNTVITSSGVFNGTSNGAAIGPIQVSDAVDTNIDMFVYNGNGSKAFSHTMVVGNNISTSGDPSMVGADADLYIGSVQNVTVTPMSTIRAVTEEQMTRLAARLGKTTIELLNKGAKVESEVGQNVDYGSVSVIATGSDAKGKPIYLIRDIALGYGPTIQSNFVYSQKQLLTQIIPAKAKEIVDLMYLGTKEEAQAIANRTKKAVYLSLRMPTDTMFAVVNKKVNGKVDGHPYNVTIDTAQPGINYLVVLPTNASEQDYSDEVEEKYQVIKAWADMIAKNENEKLHVRNKLNNYDIAGSAGVNYSETFDASYSSSWSNFFPIGTEVDYFGLGTTGSNFTSAATIAGTLASAIGFSLLEMKAWSSPTADRISVDNGMNSSVQFSGKLLQWTLFPMASYTTVGADSEARSYSRTESFTIACDPASHLNVDVYRAYYKGDDKTDEVPVYDVFTNDNFYNMYETVKDQVNKSVTAAKINGPRGFIFRTRGGATQNPWEDQRVTKVYDPGTVLDARTLKIVNPKIRLDKQSVSGVAIDDAAKFTVYVGNDSEKPEATDGMTMLQVFALDQQNPQGAKMSINGQPLTTAGITVTCTPGKETALQMEVRAGQGFDYENLVIGVMSPTDAVNTKALTTFDVHFLREAGGLAIATPGDKWVLNTNAQMDGKRGWYIPVTINGFDRHQHNFDHIEFQYKESQRGDDSWTNLCSYYADAELMAKANGVRELMKENANITTEFYGEGWTMERAYDLRAVLFCRNGNDFLTTSSKVIRGIKDTRRPQLFGTPEPKSGLLTAGDDIVFNFSEDIEYNYLSAITNFEVKGEVNNNSLSEMVSVQFDGTTASVETEAKRNFSGKDLTIDLMVKPAETGRDMPLFSHGTNGQTLQLWLTSDFKLKAVVNGQTLTASKEMPKNIFQQVALVLNQTDSLVTLYHGGLEVGRQKLSSLYTGTGTLIFGRAKEQDSNKSQYYEGRMMEARLWYNAMDGTLIGSTYGGHHLTGYEKDLVDYYPMNEGSGDYVIDYTQGANAQLINASWAIPQGLSLHVDKADKGVLLDKNAMNRTAEQDYTLMFWFKTDKDGRGTLLSNGRGLKEDNGAVNQFHIGFEADTLKYRSNGFVANVPGNWSDGKWHHYAMTVNRGRSVANIYMDKELITTFETDSLGGISGGYPLIGASRYDIVNEKDTLLRQDGKTPLKGNVDELLFFAQALPQQLIKTYASKSPNGDEAGLLTYLSFDRQERQKDNSIELVPYVYSKKLYLDDKGQPRYQLDPETKEPTDILVRDYLFVDDEDVVLTHFDKKDAAPVVPYEEVTNLKFSFIGRGNQVLVELDEPNAKLNHRNIYVTLRDIEDLNGNTMASPQTACYYVTNSSLQWLINRLDATVKYGSGASCELVLYNNGAQNHTYTIDNCPRWLTLSKHSDAVAPQALDHVTATVNKDLNIGTYNEILYLTDEEGITEPFYLNLTVEGEQPEWADHIDSEFLANSMNISGQVYLYGDLDSDARDIVGVFDDQNQCHGFANITHDTQSGETGLYLTVYDSQASGRALNFRLWQYSTGREIVLTPESAITFAKDAMLGSDTPVRFDGGEAFVQNFKLQEGWNWVSFNLKSDQLSDVNTLLGGMKWSNGDILTDLGSNLTLTYEAAQKQWIATGSTDTVTISPKNAYAIKVKKDCTLPVSGTVIKNQDDRTITVSKGWNAIGYTPMTNLSVETALSDYFDNAEPGDVIKSHTEFAYFTKTGNTGRWRGSLQYMKPGEGYMMLRKGEADATFTYPFFDLNSNFREDWNTGTTRAAAAAKARSTMTVSAVVEGFEVEDGDVLIAYSNGGECGSVIVNSELSIVNYLSIAGDASAPIWFAIERDGEIVASTGEVMTYKANAVIGSPDQPTAINFVRAEHADGQWYSINGMKLQKRPTMSGVYIFNGRKIVVK
ncbi:MAG: LamG-like jellyroll fold domain-containing protein [Prevotella sp.]|nr:LamG-like jellyroll fold domain-containing protein [Prevotella sp.]